MRRTLAVTLSQKKSCRNISVIGNAVLPLCFISTRDNVCRLSCITAGSPTVERAVVTATKNSRSLVASKPLIEGRIGASLVAGNLIHEEPGRELQSRG